MTMIAKCPQCHELVMIPQGLAVDAAVCCPICQSEYPLSLTVGGVPPALAPVAVQGAAESAGVPPWDTLAAAEVEQPSGEVGQLPEDDDEEAIDAALFSGLVKHTASPPQKVPKKPKRIGASGAAALAKRRSRFGAQGSPLRKLLGVIGGGLLGLTIGYYLLNWIGGPRFDFMKVYLPGVPHTYRHWSQSQKTAPEAAASVPEMSP